MHHEHWSWGLGFPIGPYTPRLAQQRTQATEYAGHRPIEGHLRTDSSGMHAQHVHSWRHACINSRSSRPCEMQQPCSCAVLCDGRTVSDCPYSQQTTSNASQACMYPAPAFHERKQSHASNRHAQRSAHSFIVPSLNAQPALRMNTQHLTPAPLDQPLICRGQQEP